MCHNVSKLFLDDTHTEVIVAIDLNWSLSSAGVLPVASRLSWTRPSRSSAAQTPAAER